MCVCEKVMCDEEMDGGFLQLRAKEVSATFSTFMKDSVFYVYGCLLHALFALRHCLHNDRRPIHLLRKIKRLYSNKSNCLFQPKTYITIVMLLYFQQTSSFCFI